MNNSNEFLYLVLDSDIVATIKANGGEMFCCSGSYELSKFGQSIRTFLLSLTDEDVLDDEYPEDLYREERWFIDDGSRHRGIILPALYADGTLLWRWRE